jgi:hypothetical protein
MDRFKSPEFRAALYGVFAALSVVASVYGVLSGEQIAAILGVVGALIGLMANLNTPTAARVAKKELDGS